MNPTYEETRTATRATIRVLKTLGLHCCLFGSVACSHYGMSRSPNDVDMVVLGCVWTQEELKRRVVAADPNFYTVASRGRYAGHRVLWYRFPSSRSALIYPRSSSVNGRRCKVDLLLPGIMNIPPIPTSRIHYKDGRGSKPLMPFLPLLLLRLQGWEDHGESPKHWMRAKQSIDVADIVELLNLAEIKYPDVNLQNDEVWLPVSFVDEAKRRVGLFIAKYTSTRERWELLGF
ncbi:hypothetical protein L218DRAFT_980962 [Marasmius fiardii PR-910]|nr:hypothetical protein L218DRAFT_980962 [Marasmius fiardii PR-910]